MTNKESLTISLEAEVTVTIPLKVLRDLSFEVAKGMNPCVVYCSDQKKMFESAFQCQKDSLREVENFLASYI